MTTIAVDIGHGKNTFPPSKGTYRNGRGYAEHDFNSKLAIEVEKLLKHNGFNVIMYQKPFSPEISLRKRTDYYNSKGVDLVWSIHANANANKNVSGCCAFYWHTSSKGKQLAQLFAEEVRNAGYETHGNGLHASKPGEWTNLHITRETKAVAVLTENGFMTSDKDFELIFGSKQDQYIHDMARVHVKAICRYFGKSFKDIGTTSAQAKTSITIIQNEGGNELFTPPESMATSVSKVLLRFADQEVHKDKALDRSWREKFLKGELTQNEAIGLIYTALERGLVIGDKKE